MLVMLVLTHDGAAFVYISNEKGRLEFIEYHALGWKPSV